jgi:hypothetical protein
MERGGEGRQNSLLAGKICGFGCKFSSQAIAINSYFLNTVWLRQGKFAASQGRLCMRAGNFGVVVQ